LIDTFVMLREVQDLVWFPGERDTPSHWKWIARVEKGLALLERVLVAGA
jgi:hypothetical protein